MGGIWSSNYSSSSQIANTNITQQYSGTCQISCDNKMSDINITTISSNVDGIYVTQTCSVNGQCMMNSTANALADVLLKAQNAAASALSILPSSTSTISFQEINENIQQYVSQKCSISSSNEMNDVNIYAVNSNIANGIHIGQDAKTGGSCALSNLMTATAKATEMADDCASSGKAAKKKSCSGKGGGIGSFILYGIIALVLFTAVMMVIKYIKGGDLPDCTDDLIAKNTPCKLSQPKKTPAAPVSPYKTTPKEILSPLKTPENFEVATEAPRVTEVYARPLNEPYEPLYDTPRTV